MKDLPGDTCFGKYLDKAGEMLVNALSNNCIYYMHIWFLISFICHTDVFLDKPQKRITSFILVYAFCGVCFLKFYTGVCQS